MEIYRAMKRATARHLCSIRFISAKIWQADFFTPKAFGSERLGECRIA